MTKTLTLCAVALMCTTGLAVAAETPSGRPGKILDQQQCQKAWQAAGPKDGSLSEAAATPYTLNFARVDTSNDRKISRDEWKTGCKKGWVSADARNVTAKDTAGSGSADVQKPNNNMNESSSSSNMSGSSNMMDENQSQ